MPGSPGLSERRRRFCGPAIGWLGSPGKLPAGIAVCSNGAVGDQAGDVAGPAALPTDSPLSQEQRVQYLFRMSPATAHLLEEFDRLPISEQRELSAVIVHRAAQLDDGDITDEELTASASRIFAMLDEEEDAQAR